MKKITLFIIAFFTAFSVSAKSAENITKNANIKLNESQISSKIFDDNYKTYINIKKNDVIDITSDQNTYGIYILYEINTSKGTIKSGDKEYKLGNNNFLHEYIKFDKGSTNLSITYENDVVISEIYLLSEGDVPNWVQNWNKPCNEADLLLFSTHADDEQLFFLGLMPTYIDQGKKIQVVYLVDHSDNQKRIHEQLNGLWTIGVKNYPILGIIPDAYSESLEGALNNLKKTNITEEDIIKFQVEQIRRFKPLVVVGHDELGEYSHGQHILNTYELKKALENSKDPEYMKELNMEPWDTPKTYLHLYKKNQIVMNYDAPLETYNGKTAYEVSKEGYKMHESQQWTWFTKWINGVDNSYTKATDIKKYSPTEFGLYRSTVGEDINKNDMFENVKRVVKETPVTKEVIKESNIVKNENPSNNYILIIIGCTAFLLIALLILKLKKKNVDNN